MQTETGEKVPTNQLVRYAILFYWSIFWLFNIIDKLITAATDSNYSVGKGMVADSEQGDVEKNYEENSLQKESGSLQVEKNKINEVVC